MRRLSKLFAENSYLCYLKKWHLEVLGIVVRSLATSSPSRTALQPTMVPARLLHYWQQRLLTSSVDWSGHWTARISIRWTKRFGGFRRSEPTVARSATSITWKNDWLKSGRGVTLIRTLLTEQWISGVIDCVNVSVRKGDNSNNWFKKLYLFRLTITVFENS